ncbi:MAG: hypothetical protein ACR2IF_06655 [Terriglobales bacterium]
MKKFALVCAIALLSTTWTFAQSSKATAAINTAVGCTLSTASSPADATLPQNCHDIFSGAATEVTADNFATIMSATIKVSNSQSLFVSPSLVAGLYTNTKVKTSTGSTSSAVAAGGVYLRAIVTNAATGQTTIGYPVAVCNTDILGCHADANGNFGVTLDSRIQTLTQSISDCIVTITGGGSGTCTFDLTTDLILQTTSAHTFNFIFPNVGVGNYTIKIQAAVNSDAQVSGSGSAAGAAAYGLGSLTVESVRLVHDFSF